MKCKIVSWNCLSCFPQYYDDIKSIEKGESPDALIENMQHNMQRHKNIVHILHAFLLQIESRTLDAIVLQEVDQDLLVLLKTHLKQRPLVTVHHHKPYMTYPQRSPPPHDFAYYLVTVHHTHNMHPTFKAPHFDRCLCTPLKSCTLFNVHIPWISQHHSEFKKTKTTQTVASIARVVKSFSKSIFIGDLNQSCPFNQMLFAKYFNKTMFTRFVCGESYKLSPEHVLSRKTFRSLSQTPDDGCIVHKRTNVRTSFVSIKQKKLPVDKRGWFLPDQTNCFPSDHALFKVECNIPPHHQFVSKRTIKQFGRRTL